MKYLIGVLLYISRTSEMSERCPRDLGGWLRKFFGPIPVIKEYKIDSLTLDKMDVLQLKITIINMIYEVF